MSRPAAKSELVTNPIKIVTDIQVTTSDVMAIGIVEIEGRLEEQIKDLSTQLKAKESVASKLNDRIQSHKTNRVNEYFAEAKAALEAALKLAGLDGKVNVNCGYGSTIVDDVETFNGTIACCNNQRQQEFVANSEHITLMKEKGQANTEVARLREKLVEAKMNLTKLPSLERKYRAQLAKAQLNRSSEGRDLLAAMQESTTSDLTRLALPAK